MSNQSNQRNQTSDPDRSMAYQIRIKGQLDRHWAGWFDDMVITLDDGGETLLTGPVADQAALYGVLRKVRDLGLPLLSVVCIGPSQTDVAETV